MSGATCEHGWRYREVAMTCLGLPRFLDGLDSCGWEGEKRWRGADRDIAVAARWGSRGHNELEWSVSVVTDIEAGAAKDAFVAELRNFLAVETV